MTIDDQLNTLEKILIKMDERGLYESVPPEVRMQIALAILLADAIDSLAVVTGN